MRESCVYGAHMRRAITVGALILFVALPATAGIATRGEDISEVPVSITALTAAELVRNEIPADGDFQKVTSTESPLPPGLAEILGVSAVTIPGVATAYPDLGSVEVLRGPQGTVFGRYSDLFGITVTNEADSTFYSTQPSVTVYGVRMSERPTASEEEITEISLGFLWPGEQPLGQSEFAYDSLLPYANVVNIGSFGAEAFNIYSRLEQNIWTPYADVLFGFEFDMLDGSYWKAWAVPGDPVAAGFTYSFSPELSLDGMWAQHAEVTPSATLQVPLGVTYGALDDGLQLSVQSYRDGVLLPSDVADGPPPEPEESVPSSEPVTEDVTEPSQPPASEAPEEDVALPEQPGDSGGGLVPVVVVGGVVLTGAAALAYRRHLATTAAASGPVAAPPGAPPASPPEPGPPPEPAPSPYAEGVEDMLSAFLPPVDDADGGGVADHLSDSAWDAALHQEEKAQQRIETEISRIFEGAPGHPGSGIINGIQDYMSATDRFQSAFTKVMSATTEFQGMLQEWQEAQGIAQNQDLAFALTQLLWSGYSVSKFLNAPAQVPWHRSSATGRMLASGDRAAAVGTGIRAGGGGAKTGDNLATGTASGDSIGDGFKLGETMGDSGSIVLPRTPEELAAMTPAQQAAVLKEYYKNTERLPWVHDVLVHGRCTGGMALQSGKPLAFADVVWQVVHTPGIQQVRWIRYISCWGASNGNAAALARATGKWVVAPTGRVNVWSTGHVLPELTNGMWLAFDPSGKARYILSNDFTVLIGIH
jgi:hypothetical protein